MKRKEDEQDKVRNVLDSEKQRLKSPPKEKVSESEPDKPKRYHRYKR